MRLFICLFGVILVILFITVLVLFGGYDFTIQQGSFKGLKIGMSKNEVVTELARQEVGYIEPMVNEHTRITRITSGQLSRLNNADGICITDNRGFGFDITFDQQDMSHAIHGSYNVDFVSLGLQASLPRKVTMERIKDILLSRDGIVVFNCILGADAMSLKNVNYIDLEKIDGWLYHIPNSHSAATLYFDRGKLAKIIYHWHLFEMP